MAIAAFRAATTLGRAFSRARPYVQYAGRKLVRAAVNNGGKWVASADIGSHLVKGARKMLRGKGAKRRVATSSGMTVAPSKTTRTVRSRAGATPSYGGRFRRASSKPKSNAFVSKGFENKLECVGTVTDADCVYVGATCSPSRVAIEAVGYALLRRLFEKGIGQTVKNIKDQLVGYWNSAAPFANGDGFRLQLTIMNVLTGTSTQIHYDTQVTDSIYSIIGQEEALVSPGWTDLIVRLKTWASGQYVNDANLEQPMLLQIFRKDGNGTAFWDGSGSIDLRNVRIHYKSTIDFKLQNRSLSHSGGTDADDVTNNPLQGFKIEFRGGAPMLKDIQHGFFKLSRMAENQGGTLLGTGAQLALSGPSAVGKEPVHPNKYGNVSKYSKVKLMPGEVRNTMQSYGFNSTFMGALKKIGNEVSSDSARYSANNAGKCVMFALEDMINVNATNKICVSYEIDRVIGCYITEHKKSVAHGAFHTVTHDLLS